MLCPHVGFVVWNPAKMLFGCVHFLGFILGFFTPYSFSAMILCGVSSLFHTVQLLRDDPVRCLVSFSHRTASTRWFCVVLVLFFTPYSFYAMILCGARSLFHTVQLLRDDSVWCLVSFSHRTASTRWFCAVLGLFFTPYSFYTMILYGARYLPELTTDDVHNNLPCMNLSGAKTL